MIKIIAEERERTLTVVRRMVTEPKTALTGGALEVVVRSKASISIFMATFVSGSRSLDRLVGPGNFPGFRGRIEGMAARENCAA